MSGTEASIKKLGPADLRAFYDANYHPNNAALIVAGDTTEAALRGKLDTAFKGWRSKHVAAKKVPYGTLIKDPHKYFMEKSCTKGEEPKKDKEDSDE